MITKQRTLFFFVGETPYKNLADAQKADLLLTLQPFDFDPAAGIKEQIADWLIGNASQVVDILTTTPTSRMKARKLHGGTKKHKQKVQAAPLEQK